MDSKVDPAEKLMRSLHEVLIDMAKDALVYHKKYKIIDDTTRLLEPVFSVDTVLVDT